MHINASYNRHMHPEIEKLELPELVDRLDDLEGRRTPIGWTPDDAAKRVAIERRIMTLVGGEPPNEERREALRLPCQLDVKLRSKEQSVKATVKDIGVGGVFVEAGGKWIVGTVVELEVRGSATDEHGLRVRGEIAWQRDANQGVGISFTHRTNDAHERRLRRFVLELLRHRLN